MREHSMPTFCEVTGGKKTKIYFRGTKCRGRVLPALRTVNLGLTRVGNQAKQH
jgi:hypothetical protein